MIFDTSLQEKIVAALDTVRPFLQQHNGNVEFVRYEKPILYVRLIGACIQCPFSLYTLKLGIEEQMRELIPEIKSVEMVDE